MSDIAFPPPRTEFVAPERPEPPQQTEGMTPDEWYAVVAEWDIAEAQRDAEEDVLREQHQAAFQAEAETAWASLTMDEKFRWAESHDIHTLVDGDKVYDVATRTEPGA